VGAGGTCGSSSALRGVSARTVSTHTSGRNPIAFASAAREKPRTPRQRSSSTANALTAASASRGASSPLPQSSSARCPRHPRVGAALLIAAEEAARLRRSGIAVRRPDERGQTRPRTLAPSTAPCAEVGLNPASSATSTSAASTPAAAPSRSIWTLADTTRTLGPRLEASLAHYPSPVSVRVWPPNARSASVGAVSLTSYSRLACVTTAPRETACPGSPGAQAAGLV
jgi:hypothetical protein